VMRRSGWTLLARTCRASFSLSPAAVGPGSVAASGQCARDGSTDSSPAHHRQHHLRRPDQQKAVRIPGPPSDAGDLYDAVVHGGAAARRRKISEDAAMNPPTAAEVAHRERLDVLAGAADAAGCLAVLDEMVGAGFVPPPFLYTQAMRACVPNGDVTLAATFLARLDACEASAAKERAVNKTRALMGLVNASKKQPAAVLRVLGWTQEAAERDVRALVDEMDLRRDAVAWGLVAWSLNRLGMPFETMRLLDEVTQHAGLPLTDSLYHLSIEALGMLGRFEDADALFSLMQDRGVVAHERTIGSLLRVLTSPHLASQGSRRRPPADPDRIRELCSIVAQPSERFVSTSLRAYASCSLVAEAEQAFKQLSAFRDGNVPDERSCMTLMRLYGKLLISGAAREDVPEQELERWHRSLSAKADDLWKLYVDSYGDAPPSDMEAHARLTMFPRYVLAKSVAGELRVALQLLVDALQEEAAAARPWFQPDVKHFESLLFGVERALDVDVLLDTLQVMSDAEIECNGSCLASAILVLVGSGDAVRAAKLVCLRAASLAEDEQSDAVHVTRRKRLGRRLDLLIDGLTQSADAAGSDGDAAAETRALIGKVREIAARCAQDPEPPVS
jgi:pentatricopeptide repeat protein